MAKTPVKTILTFKVTPAGNARIWRRIAVGGNQTLDHLHNAIFKAFDRYEEHLYSFYVAKPGKRGRAALRDADEYTHPYALTGGFDDGRRGNAKKTKLDDLGLQVGQRLYYLFDFGDQWWHELTVEETDGQPEPGRYPRVLEKRGESPPQYAEEDEEE